MEIGSEIHQKIRLAIKAKLVDLGAYVDDELPDYIMVMVANKKTREQMTDDLNLFLGSNTEKFTSWLGVLLEKLQTLSADDKEKPTDDAKTPSPPPKPTAEPATTPLTSAEVPRKLSASEPPKKQSSTDSTEPPKKQSSTEPPKKQSSTEAHRKLSSSEASKKQSVTEATKRTENKHDKGDSRKDKEHSIGGDHSTAHKKVHGDKLSSTTETSRKRTIDVRSSTITITNTSHTEINKKSRISQSHPTDDLKKSDGNIESKNNMEPEIVLAADKDVFEEENQESAKISVVQSHSQDNGADNTYRETSRTSPKLGVASPIKIRKESHTSVSSRQTESSRQQSRSARDTISRHLQQNTSSSSSSSRKRRAPSSTVGAIVTRAEEVEEEYDPFKPAIGKVASKVKVTERKSKVPSTWQADKSLLVKACNAANTSIEKKSKQVIVKPISRSEHDEPQHKKMRSTVHSRLGGRKSRSPPSRMRSERTTSSSQDRSHARDSRSSRQSHHSSDRSTRETRSSSDRSIQLYTRTKDDEVFSRLRSKVMENEKQKNKEATGKNIASNDDKPKEEEGEEIEEEEKRKEEELSESESEGNVAVATEDILELCIPEDNRLIEYDPDDDSHASSISIPMYKATPIRQTVTTLIESGAEESDFTDGEGPDNRVVKQRERPTKFHERPASPKFVVTLDGVDPSLLKQEIKYDIDSDTEQEIDADLEAEMEAIQQEVNTAPIKSESNIVRVEPRPQRPVIQPITVNLGEPDDYETESYEGGDVAMETMESETIPERCHFWPGCKNGDTCPYYHPTEQCIKFPRCKYTGDKCLFIHPSCKFELNCNRPRCPFAHTVKKLPTFAAPTMPVIVQPIRVPVISGGFYPPAARMPRPPGPRQSDPMVCKFYPNCTNMNCSYTHPKLCRYGIACMKKDTCSFTHPKLPSLEQMSWTSKKATSSPTTPTTETQPETAPKT